MHKALFVCGKNKLRSPTAEAVFSQKPEWEVRSAGVNSDADIVLGENDILWADTIFVMEKKHKQKIQKQFKSCLKNQRLICLDIPDIYEYMDERLVLILRDKVSRFFKE